MRTFDCPDRPAERGTATRRRVTLRAISGALLLLLAAPLWAAETVFSPVTIDWSGLALPEASYQFSTGNALVANISGRGRVGAIAGGSSAVIIPEVTAFGQTIVPEVRADTRSGLRVSTAFEAHAGVVLSAGMDIGGSNIDVGFEAGPSLVLPDRIRAGTFFGLDGRHSVTNAAFDLGAGLPRFNAGVDVVLGGSASGKVEYGLFPLVPFRIGEFTFDLPDLNFPLFNLFADFNLPDFPDINLPGLPTLTNDPVDSIRLKLPPNNPALSAGEVQIVNPFKNLTHETTTDGNAIVNTVKGDLLRVGLDLDGLASFAVAGTSFTGLELPIEVNDTKLATLVYDTLDVKFGLEVDYTFENRLDTFFEATINFLDPVSEEARDVMMRVSEGNVEERSTWSGRWDELPDVALFGTGEVLLDVEFTGLKREITNSGRLALSDYLEISALLLKLKVAPGVSASLGPLFRQKLELLGELASFDLFESTLVLSDFGFAAGMFGDSLLIAPEPEFDAYLTSHGDPFVPERLRLIATHAQPGALDDVVVNIAAGFGTERSRADLAPAPNIVDPGLGGGEAAPEVVLAGLAVPEGSSLYLATNARRLRLRTVENDGQIQADGYLALRSLDPDSLLSITGDGVLRFGTSGGIEAGTLVNGAGHLLRFQKSGGAALTRRLTATQRIDNAGELSVSGGVLAPVTPEIHNRVGGVLRAVSDGTLNLQGMRLVNEGTVQSLGADFLFFGTRRASVNILIPGTIEGGAEAAPGLFTAEIGDMTFEGAFGPNGFEREIRLEGALDFVSRDEGVITFEDPVELNGGAVRLVTEPGGTLVLNGLVKRNESDLLEIENAGLLEIASGRTSLRVELPPCTGNCGAGGGPEFTSEVRPVDLVNEGTIRVHAGAQFAFDVDITDYSEGGATLTGGTWELLGAHVPFTSGDPVTNPSQTAVIDVQVASVFGEAGRFDDLVFEGELDPDTGEIVPAGDISELDTRLVVSEANVTLSGAAKFDYFNTVEINRGTFTLLNHHDFQAAGSYTNEGGTTVVDSGARLVVRGALTVNGGNVTWRAGSRFRINGENVTLEDGSVVRRDIEVNGGALVIEERVVADNLGLIDPFAFSDRDGLRLSGGRSWIVRDSVGTDAFGNEVVTPGLVDLGIRAFGESGQQDGIQGVTRLDADVVIEGAQAEFRGLESTVNRIRGSLTLRGGKVMEQAATNLTVTNGGSLTLEGAQYRNGTGRLSIIGGTVSVDENSYVEVNRVLMTQGTLNLAGVLDTPEASFFGGMLAMTGGVLYAESVTATAGFTMTGGRLYGKNLEGEFWIDGGTFAPGQSIAETTIDGSLFLDSDAILEIEWDGVSADVVTVSGQASLGGTLEIALLDGYLPEVGTSLEFLTAASILGSFDAVLPAWNAVPGLAFLVREEGGSLFVDVAAVPLPAGVWLMLSALLMLLARRRHDAMTRGGCAR